MTTHRATLQDHHHPHIEGMGLELERGAVHDCYDTLDALWKRETASSFSCVSASRPMDDRMDENDSDREFEKATFFLGNRNNGSWFPPPTAAADALHHTFPLRIIHQKTTTTRTNESTTTTLPSVADLDSTKATGTRTSTSTAKLYSGIVAGATQAGVFNPYDRALYLSIQHHRPFLHSQNWSRPYLGFLQSLGGRALAGGLYFPMEHYFLCLFNHNNPSSTTANQPTSNFLAGLTAGACNAIILNPLTVVRYKTWSRPVNRGLIYEASQMLVLSVQQRGRGGYVLPARPFYIGLVPTVMRDVVFGGVYTACRLQIQWYNHHTDEPSLSQQQHDQWKANAIAAGLATVVAGPFNYVRTVQYGTIACSSRGAQTSVASTFAILQDLWRQVQQRHPYSWYHQGRMLQTRLRIGWGTLRVALGMSFAHAIYDALLWQQQQEQQFPLSVSVVQLPHYLSAAATSAMTRTRTAVTNH